MRKPVVAANWKMNVTVAEAVAYYESFRIEVENISGVDIILAPAFTAIPKLSELLGGSQKVRLAAQNFYFERSGAFTGEISAMMLRELYVRYVIIGHSERRQIFGETDELINKKVKAALASELKPIFCIGETLAEREAGKEEEVLERQIREGLKGVSDRDICDVTIAYEPVWAIGTGVNATPDQAQSAHRHVRGVLASLYSSGMAEKLRIQYGGSVKPSNARELMSQPDIDGALVGGASLDPRNFAEIVKAALKCRDCK